MVVDHEEVVTEGLRELWYQPRPEVREEIEVEPVCLQRLYSPHVEVRYCPYRGDGTAPCEGMEGDGAAGEAVCVDVSDYQNPLALSPELRRGASKLQRPLP